MITAIKISGFKSFMDFKMEFAPLTLIAGANASGKSNLFDALQLLARLAETDIRTAFNDQRGNPQELFTKFSETEHAHQMSFVADMLVNRTLFDNWGGQTSLSYTRLRYSLTLEYYSKTPGFESVRIVHESLDRIPTAQDIWVRKYKKLNKDYWKVEKAGGTPNPFISTDGEGLSMKIKLRQDGGHGGKPAAGSSAAQTVLSGVNSVEFRHALAAKQEMQSWRFLQLNPDALREPTRQEIGIQDVMTRKGEYMAAALYRIANKDSLALKDISRTLNRFVPEFTQVIVLNDGAHKQYIIKLRSRDGKEFSSLVLSEGTLRLLALCILANDDLHNGVLCFEEPENGIHPARIDALAELLLDLVADFGQQESIVPLRQVLVNTHSPVLMKELVKLNRKKEFKGALIIWMTDTITSFTEGDIKSRFQKTRVKPVIDESIELEFFTEQDAKLGLLEAEKYLTVLQSDSLLSHNKAS